jgi:peptide-methionine (S)-S-oxide reductase
MGGHGEYPNYGNYTANNNTFSETVRIEFDETKTSYASILETYWLFAPDPTEPPLDVAYQLRLFYTNENQKQLAEESIVRQTKLHLNQTVYVEVLNASDWVFWKAEENQQQLVQHT